MIFKMSVRIYQDGNKVFGPGIAQLLHRVRELHSLRAAANSMNMAYSKAWTVLRTAENAQAQFTQLFCADELSCDE